MTIVDFFVWHLRCRTVYNDGSHPESACRVVKLTVGSIRSFWDQLGYQVHQVIKGFQQVMVIIFHPRNYQNVILKRLQAGLSFFLLSRSCRLNIIFVSHLPAVSIYNTFCHLGRCHWDLSVQYDSLGHRLVERCLVIQRTFVWVRLYLFEIYH